MKPEPMVSVFARRKNRFRMLDAAVALVGWEPKKTALLEVGCSYGDASIHMAEQGFDVTAIDLNEKFAERALQDHETQWKCRFIKVDACHMPFEDESFDGIYSEAAFSVISEKSAAIREYKRVLRPGGCVVIIDFAKKRESYAPIKTGIPCMDGALSVKEYCELFADAGFSIMESTEDFFEFAKILSLVCSEYGVEPGKAGNFLTGSFGSGAKAPALTYCRAIFKKE